MDEEIHMFREPAWLTGKADQRVAFMVEEMGGDLTMIDGHTVLMTPLTECGENATKKQLARWELTCDNCGRWCVPPTAFYTGTVQRIIQDVKIFVFYGACKNCVGLPDA